MRCSNCGCDQFNEDDATGQLICLECGIGTGIYHGITQSQEYTETKGLRVVGKLEDTNKSRAVVTTDVVDVSMLTGLDADFTSTPMQAIDGNQPRSSSLRKTKLTRMQTVAQDDLIRSFMSSDGADEDDEYSKFQADQTGIPKQHYRPWRLSEPFTCILRRQTEELATQLHLSETRRTRFLDAVWHLWLNYLSITGELGEAAWTHASVGPIRATRTMMDLCDLKWIQRCGTSALLAYLKGPAPYGARAAHGGQTDQEADATEHRLRQFMWAGWSTLYEPNEGRERKDPFLKPLLDSHRTAVAKYRRISAGRGKLKRRRASTRKSDGPDAEDLEAADTPNSPSVTNRGSKPPRRLPAGRKSSANEEAPNRDIELPSIKAMSDQELIGLLQADEESVCSTLPQSSSESETPRERGRPKQVLDRRNVYRNHIIKKLLLPDPWKRVFWRGQIHGRIRCMLSHNLAILYFACLSISPTHQSVVNPISWPHKDNSLLSVGQVALTSMVTLNDLHELCKERRMTFVKARESLPPGQFAIHDQYLIPLLQPKRPPPLEVLTKATNQMLHFLGCFQLPRLPFGWLVERSVIALGLPEAVYTVCRLLLKRLRVILSHSTGLPTGPLLVCSIPWLRVLRVEVTAMALVVISLRLLFKFDDLSEVRLLFSYLNEVCSDQFLSYPDFYVQRKLMQSTPFICVYFRPSIGETVGLKLGKYYRLAYVAQFLKGSRVNSVRPNLDALPFDWTLWATYVERRFGRSSLSAGGIRSDNATCGSDVPLRSNSLRGSDLVLLKSTSEFLGPYEFKFGESIGWGESVMYSRKHGQVESKSALTKPLRELCAEREEDQTVAPTCMSVSSSPAKNDDHLSEKCLTQVQKDGLLGPFRKASLDFLLQSGTQDSSDLFCAPVEVDLSSPQRKILASWWREFGERRSRYVPICAWGSWTGNSTSVSDSSRTRRPQCTGEPTFPIAVERLIRAHNNQLAEFLQLSATGFPAGACPKTKIDGLFLKKPLQPADSYKTPELCGTAQSLSAKTTNAAVVRAPSESIQWLVQICASACGSVSNMQLLAEIEMLELMLFSSKQKPPEALRQADLALIACLDLR
ncbi:hypothetical protein FGIG_09146 [Fasciola gigantica]|uniref:Rrn7/TAF1B C-terminal cyclin domain-containing protein n=1 Tax=Fasciola gigantica TaxID=46835 RepID=A0A504YHQ9_FASGI|nr:hypothetical protein FGIG_09146 [Fasciola gigantica]